MQPKDTAGRKFWKICVRDFFILLGAGALLLSNSYRLMSSLRAWRNNTEWWGDNQGGPGDLARMAHLDFVKKFSSGTENCTAGAVSPDVRGNSILYLFGDSYMWFVGKSAFNGISGYYFYDKRSGQNTFSLNEKANNILIIEISERLFREYFETQRMLADFHDARDLPPAYDQDTTMNLLQKTIYRFFNKQINRNLEFNLFDYNLALPVFRAKAAVNYYLFGRASGDVMISGDGCYLLLKETVSPFSRRSSYSPISEAETNLIISNLNGIDSYYKMHGFKKVYLSIIPNTTTILQPTGYNGLIPLVQKNARLRMEVIDIYSVFRQSGKELYLRGDTHWNAAGKQRYIDLVNAILAQQ